MFWSKRSADGNVCNFANVITVAFFCCCFLSVTGCIAVPVINQPMLDRALQGDREAQFEIGETYYRSRYAFFGRSADWKDAARWYQMAANQGDARAHYRLSQYYFSHQSDYSQSFRWLKLPAQQGIAEAQHFLGMHYAQGWGTPQNLVLAYKWTMLAFDGDISDPNHKVVSLEFLVSEGKMSPDQIHEAKRLATIHTETHGKSRLLDPGRRTLLEMR